MGSTDSTGRGLIYCLVFMKVPNLPVKLLDNTPVGSREGPLLLLGDWWKSGVIPIPVVTIGDSSSKLALSGTTPAEVLGNLTTALQEWVLGSPLGLS